MEMCGRVKIETQENTQGQTRGLEVGVPASPLRFLPQVCPLTAQMLPSPLAPAQRAEARDCEAGSACQPYPSPAPASLKGQDGCSSRPESPCYLRSHFTTRPGQAELPPWGPNLASLPRELGWASGG